MQYVVMLEEHLYASIPVDIAICLLARQPEPFAKLVNQGYKETCFISVEFLHLWQR